MHLINTHGGLSAVSPPLREHIFCKIRDGAGNAFFKEWRTDKDAMTVLVSWLRSGVKGESGCEGSVMPILHVSVDGRENNEKHDV